MGHPRLARHHRGAATVELAVLLPFLTFLFAVAIDYCRVLYYAAIVESAARNGALFGSRDSSHAANTSGIQTAALADAGDLTPAPTVSSSTGTDSNSNPQLTVTVSWTFKTALGYPGLPSTVNLSSTVAMRVLP